MPRPKKQKDKYGLIDEEYQNSVLNADEAQLKDKLVLLDTQEQQVFKTKEEDQEYNELKEKVKEAGEPYRFALNEIKQKRSLIVDTLKGRGQA